MYFVFFFQAEDGIRDGRVTGVQTCALPICRHVPDFLLVHADKSVRVVNVKSAGKLADPQIAEALAWLGDLFEAHGWQHEIWTGADPVLLANVRFLAGYRRP